MRFSYYLFIIFILSSCSKDPNLILQSEEIIDQNPERALLLLDSVSRPNLLSDSEFNKYVLLQIKAKDKLYMDIRQDTAIFRTTAYYEENKNYQKATQANYYCGRLYHENQLYKDAVNYYFKAEKYANKIPDDYNQKGVIQINIGYLLYNDSDYKESMAHFRKALVHFNKINNFNNIVSANIEIGNCYTMLAKEDSAQVYYNKSLLLAETSDLPDVKISALQNLALIYQIQGDNREALTLYNDILKLSIDSATQAQVYFSLSRVYQNLNQKDSMYYYLYKSMEVSEGFQNPHLTASLYSVSSNINEESGNYQKALSDYKIYTHNFELISSEQEKKSVLDIEQRYRFEQIRNINNELYIKNTRYFIASLLLLITLIVSFLIYRSILAKKERLINEAEDKILQLNNLALSYDENRNSFRDILLHHFDILKKSTMIRVHLRSDEIKQGEKLLNKFNDIVYKQEELDWDMLYETMNKLHDGFFDTLKKIVPNLDESEFKICCLIYTDFTNQEIGIIMKLSTSSIAHKRSSIRKKIGLEDYGNIDEKLKSLS